MGIEPKFSLNQLLEEIKSKQDETVGLDNVNMLMQIYRIAINKGVTSLSIREICALLGWGNVRVRNTIREIEIKGLAKFGCVPQPYTRMDGTSANIPTYRMLEVNSDAMQGQETKKR